MQTHYRVYFRKPRSRRPTRQRIVAGAYRLFYREGFQRTGVDAVAEAAGVTKRTLYNHFSSKDELIAAVLEAQTALAAAETNRWCDIDSPSPEDLVRSLFDGLRSWAGTTEWRGSGFTRAAMELAWTPGHPARRASAAQKQAVEHALARALKGAGVDDPPRKARQLAVLIEGAMALRMIHGDQGWFDVAEEAALALVADRSQR